MNKITIISAFLFLLVTSTGCVESSKKYKALQAQLDSVQVMSASKNAEFEEVFATLNEIEQGLKSIRETENLLVLQSAKGGEVAANAREQMKIDVQYIASALENYKSQVARLEKDKKYQSAEFQKRLKGLMAELNSKTKLVEELSTQLNEKDNQLKIKTQEVISLDQSLAVLKDDLMSLQKENTQQTEKIGEQDAQIYSGYYILGSKSDLIAANVMSKGGLFRAAKVSYQAEQAAFKKIDIRNVTEIPLNARKGKVLSVHPSGTYSLITDGSGMMVLNISNANAFWEQTKYLVIKID